MDISFAEVTLQGVLFFLAAICFFVKAFKFRPKIVVVDLLSLGFMFIALALAVAL